MKMVSVIIPVYNVERYLEPCLDSVFHQTCQDMEVICVNDCSEDSSGAILKKYEERYRCLRVLENECHSGVSVSRNRGLSEARGRYVFFVDSDDRIEPYALEKLVGTAEEKRSDIVYFNKRTVFEEGIKAYACQPFIYQEDPGCLTGKEMFVRFMQDATLKSMNVYTQFFRREFLTEHSLTFPDGLVHEDYLFFFECAMKAQRTVNLNDVLYVYRVRKGSLTTSPKLINVYSLCQILKKLLDYWENGDFTREENEAVGAYVNHIYHYLEWMKDTLRIRRGGK